MCCSSKDAFKGVCGGGLIHTAETSMCRTQPVEALGWKEQPPLARDNGASWEQKDKKDGG